MRLSVLHVLNSAHGGSAISTFQLIEFLNQRDVTSSLVCYNNASRAQVEQISKLVDGRILFIPLYWTNKRIRARWWKRPLLEAYSILTTWKGHRFQRQIDELVKRADVNIIHTSTLVNPEGAIAAKRNNLPHVWHVRELVGPKVHYHFWNYSKWAKEVARNCDILVANSEITKQNLLSFFSESKIVNIPNGIETHHFTIKQHSNNRDPLVVGMVGNITTRWKNHRFFIETAAEFSNGSNVEFRIYGALPEQHDEYLHELQKLMDEKGASKKVRLMGHVGHPAEIMKEIDVLFHPTGLESFGRIFAEAMAAAVPIVAVNEGGALELVRNSVNGFLVKLNDTVGAAALIRQLLDSPELRNRLGSAGRSIVTEKYTINRYVEGIHSLYTKLLSNRIAN